MVSQPDTATSINLREASSVVSRPSLSRSKRHNRSHAGGATYVTQNEFPIFTHSGDVEIVIHATGRQNRYLLHRHTLTRCSGFFEKAIGREPSSTHVTSTVRENSDSPGPDQDQVDASNSATRRRWRFELDLSGGSGTISMLVQTQHLLGDFNRERVSLVRSSSNGPSKEAAAASDIVQRMPQRYQSHAYSSSAHSSHGFFRSVANLGIMSSATSVTTSSVSSAEIDMLRDYDNLFRIFYNYSPVLDGVNIADAYLQCKTLLSLADSYSALSVVGPRVDHHLLQFQSRLWKQIAKYPISYLRIGYLSHSRIIFKEALIHVVGQWPAGERSLRAALPDVVLEIIEDKVDELEEVINRTETCLYRLSLTTSRGERVTPATSYLDWLAISLFRQWLADNADAAAHDYHSAASRDSRSQHSRERGIASLVNTGKMYRVLGASAGTYLSHDECKRFLKLTPEFYSRDNLRRFEKRIDELKAMAREVVRPLTGSCLELDVAGNSRMAEAIPYLTCTSVGDRDLPW